MIKRTTLLLLITLLFTACTERGHTLSLKDVKRSVFFSRSTQETPKMDKREIKCDINETAKVKEPAVSQNVIVKKETSKITKPFKEKKTILTQKIKKETINKSTFFDMSDETKKKLSGFFIYIIAIMIIM